VEGGEYMNYFASCIGNLPSAYETGVPNCDTVACRADERVSK